MTDAASAPTGAASRTMENNISVGADYAITRISRAMNGVMPTK